MSVVLVSLVNLERDDDPLLVAYGGAAVDGTFLGLE